MVKKKAKSKAFDLNWALISNEYLGGKKLKWLADKYEISHWTLLDNFKKFGVKKTQRRFQDIDVFDQFTKDSCYWAGFLAADGWTQEYSVGIQLGIVDEKHLIKLMDFLKSNAKIIHSSKISKCTKKEYKYSTIYFYSKKLVTILKNKFNIVPNKSLIYQIPQIPTKYYNHFIRGYMDGDGSIGWHKRNKKPRLNICSGSPEVIEWIASEINLRFPNEVKIYIRKNGLSVIEYLGYQTRDILNWIYQDSDDSIRLKRKYDHYLKCLNKLSQLENELENKINSKKHFTDKIISMYEFGMSSKEIGKELKINYQKVLYYLRGTNIEIKSKNNQNLIGLARKQRDLEMLRQYRNGNKPKDIAIENNLALSSFWVAIRRAKHVEEQA